MIKASVAFSVIMTLILGISGCSSKTPIAQSPKDIQNELSNAPKWVLTQDTEKGISSSGSAKIGNAGMQFAITEAEANARDMMHARYKLK